MRYDDLIAFEPIDSVKVLTEADSEDLARRDVSTFVISPQMRRMLVEQLLPHLRLDGSVDTKAVLVVANYGTGKTHLMATISSVLEHADLAADLRDDARVAEAIEASPGPSRSCVPRSAPPRWDCATSSAESSSVGSSAWAWTSPFRRLSGVSNTKDSLVDMMAAFEEVEPERGLLFVLDELLDYLRSRRDAELIVDLAFLREIGEICRSTRFRFIAGIQEALFDNPRFASRVATRSGACATASSRFASRARTSRTSSRNGCCARTPSQKAKIRRAPRALHAGV